MLEAIAYSRKHLSPWAELYEAEGNTDEARKRYERVMQLDPAAGVAANNLAFIYVQHGGNLDIRDVAVGTRLRLPVAVDGALLSIGDTHAAMGDGEVCGTGVETGSVVTVRVTVEKGAAPPAATLETVLTPQRPGRRGTPGRKGCPHRRARLHRSTVGRSSSSASSA